MSQKDAVFNAVVNVIGEEFSTPVELNKSQLSEVHEQLVMGFVNGEIPFRSGPPDETTARKYVPGLVNNWLRKDTRLNGGAPYQPKNPGSRSGAGDESIKAMKALLAGTQDPDARRQIQEAIEARKAELKPTPVVNVEALPEHLRHLAS